MSGITAAAQRAGRAGRGLLPTGQLLTSEVWARRHQGIVWLLWAYVAGIAVFAVARGNGPAHGATEASLVAVFALAASHPVLDRRAPRVGGRARADHRLGRDRPPLRRGGRGPLPLLRDDRGHHPVPGLAAVRAGLGYVVVHHTVLGTLAPAEVFNHPAAQHAPWRWALIHGAFVLAASVAYLVNWRLSERQAIEIGRLVSRLEGLARTDPLTGVPNRRVWEEELPGSWSGPGGWAPGCAWP